MKLTQEEKGLLDSVEKGEWKRIPNFTREAVRYRDAARATLRKDRPGGSWLLLTSLLVNVMCVSHE